MLLRASIPVLLFATVLLAQQPPILITDRLNEFQLVRLAGNTRPEATAANDRGAVSDDFAMAHLTLQLRRSPEQQSELDQFTGNLQNPASSEFHHWLNAQTYGSRFGLAAPDIAAITNWLASHGFQINVVFPSNDLIDFSGTAGQVRSAFHTEIHNLLVNGEAHIANMSDPQIPAALSPQLPASPHFTTSTRIPKTALPPSPLPWKIMAADATWLRLTWPLFTI